jgi:hypothetical protein
MPWGLARQSPATDRWRMRDMVSTSFCLQICFCADHVLGGKRKGSNRAPDPDSLEIEIRIGYVEVLFGIGSYLAVWLCRHSLPNQLLDITENILEGGTCLPRPDQAQYLAVFGTSSLSKWSADE